MPHKKKKKKLRVDNRNYYEGVPFTVINETIRQMNDKAVNGILYFNTREEIDSNTKATVSYCKRFNIDVPKIAVNGNTETMLTLYFTLPVRIKT